MNELSVPVKTAALVVSSVYMMAAYIVPDKRSNYQNMVEPLMSSS